MNPLAGRLRELRTKHWAGRPVSQVELATALGIRNTTISSWESPTSPKLPPERRLQEIAGFFATRRSLDGPRLLSDDELDDSERAGRETLHTELHGLWTREAGAGTGTASGEPRSPWHFPDGGEVRILCGRLPPKDRSPFASGRDHNYMALGAYADLDALTELFGHIRAENPDTDVQYELVERLESDDLRAHLVLLGNIAWAQESTILGQLDIPVRQVHEKNLDGEIFEILDHTGAVTQRFRPTLLGDGPTGAVVEDVGFFYRTPSPINSTRTLTVCSGVFTRGVYGAVRCLSDRSLRDQNLTYLRERFGEIPTYGLLMRVPVHDHATATPDLGDEKNWLLELRPPS